MISASEVLHGKILIVDDLMENIILIERILRGAGYVSIASTTDSSEVCDLHRKHCFDLILLDLKMPGTDGFQVMEDLKEIETEGYLPVLVISVLQEHKLRALATGARDFIAKPFDLVEVKTRIHNMLEVRLLYKQLEHHNRELASLALHDALTGLPNRRLLTDRLSLSITHAHRNHLPMAVMYLDLDGFKEINDTLGHDVGDALLCMVAARLVGAVRQEDTVARMDGDEFAIALWGYSHDNDLVRLVAKVLLAVSHPYYIRECSVNITASIGVGIYPMHGEQAETLIKSADLAMYEVKRNGKNDYRIALTPAIKALSR